MAKRRSPPSAAASSNWSCLPRDLIDSILDRLILLSDFVRFSTVCKSWNCMALNHYKQQRIPQINHQLPWLLKQPKKGQERDYSLYDFTTSKICNFPFQSPLLHKKSDYCGTSHGWLFVWDDRALKMFNPISGTMFCLPSFVDSADDGGFCKRVTLSRDPSASLTSPSPYPFEVLACSYPSKSNVIAHWKSGDKFWSYSEKIQEYEDQLRFDDFIFYKDRMLGIGCSKVKKSVVDVISISIDHTTQTHNSRRIKIERIGSTPKLENCHCFQAYLVETTRGDLLMVQKNFEFSTGDGSFYRQIWTYRVNKIIIGSNEDSVKIIPITNLNGESLFLGDNNHGISVLASNFPFCTPNSIYNAMYDLCWGGHVEVFNLEDECISKCFIHTDSIKLPVAPWIVPTMKLP